MATPSRQRDVETPRRHVVAVAAIRPPVEQIGQVECLTLGAGEPHEAVGPRVREVDDDDDVAGIGGTPLPRQEPSARLMARPAGLRSQTPISHTASTPGSTRSSQASAGTSASVSARPAVRERSVSHGQVPTSWITG